jgi:hypothetical protein
LIVRMVNGSGITSLPILGYAIGYWIPILGNTPNVSMTGIVSQSIRLPRSIACGRMRSMPILVMPLAVSFVSEIVADDRSVLQSSDPMIIQPRMITRDPTKGRGRARLYHGRYFARCFPEEEQRSKAPPKVTTKDCGAVVDTVSIGR